MKKTTITLFLIAICSLSIQSQEASVEKSIYGVQTGLLGVWGYNESRLSNEFSLRTEVGLDFRILNSFFIPGGNKTLWAPSIRLEPRWYFNLEKRLKKGKNISNNRGNFLSLAVTYFPDLFVISSVDNIFVPNQFSVLPTWGIRRHLGKKITFETGIGIGYGKVIDKRFRDEGEVIGNIHLRFGFDF